MATQILVGSRKGTFIVDKTGGRWALHLAGHAGVGVNFVARDPGTGSLWAALGHGHWGAKLSRSTDGGATWADAAQIKYPVGARYLAPPDPSPEDAPDAAAAPGDGAAAGEPPPLPRHPCGPRRCSSCGPSRSVLRVASTSGPSRAACSSPRTAARASS